MLISKTVVIKLHSRNIEHYESLGYEIPKSKDSSYRIRVKRGTKIEVKAEDLKEGSSAIVEVKCDGDECKESILYMQWANYLKYVKADGKYYCNKCALKLYGFSNSMDVRLKKGKSFHQWCIENDKLDILDRWDTELNNCTPYEVLHKSRKYMYIKCPKGLHKSELKNIGNYTGGCEATMDCKACNSIVATNTRLFNLLLNKEDGYKYSEFSGKRTNWICPACNNIIKNKQISTISIQGLSCPKCSDGKSYPEKFIYNMLTQLNVSFEIERKFDWSFSKRYDFYIPKLNCIIEAHGKQHYTDAFNISSSSREVRSLEDEYENDMIKEKLAKENRIKYYIVINCRKSEIEWIKNSILKSKISELFDLSNIEWLKCHEYACNSLVKVICDLWNSGLNNTEKISEVTSYHRSTVTTYLKRGAKIGLCDYDATDEVIKVREQRQRKVICLNTKEIFNSIVKASEKYQTNQVRISYCVRNNPNYSAGKHPETGDPLRWMYLEDYKDDDIIEPLRYKTNAKKVICITTDEIFESIKDASYKYNTSNISACCKGKYKFAGKHP